MTTIELSTPIKVAGKETYELELHEITLGDVIKMDKVTGENEKMLVLVSSIASISTRDAQSITISDFGKIMETVSAFLPAGVMDALSMPE